MDQEAHLNQSRAERVARAFSKGLDSIAPVWIERQRIIRFLLKPDPLERLVPEKLLYEAVAAHFEGRPAVTSPLVVLMNRSGHGEGARIVNGLFPLLADKWQGISVVHVSFSTPSRGLGTLVRGVLVKNGAAHGIDVHVVAHNRPAEGLKLSDADVAALVGEADLVLSFASCGSGGLLQSDWMYSSDPLIARSHVSVLSYPDPESLIGELPVYRDALGREPDLKAIRFWVQVVTPDRALTDLGFALLTPDGGDAQSRLPTLIDNARRQRYQVLLEPMVGDLPKGDPLVCPCRGLIEEGLSVSATVTKVVPAGSRLVAVAAGKQALG